MTEKSITGSIRISNCEYPYSYQSETEKITVFIGTKAVIIPENTDIIIGQKFGMLTGGKFLYKLSVPLSNDCTTFEDGKPIYVSMASPYALRELVKAIYIEAPGKSSGKRRQNIRISYDLVGFIPVEELVKEETA